MSYDARIINKKTKETLKLDVKKTGIQEYGGTIRIDIEKSDLKNNFIVPAQLEELTINCTYNYSNFFVYCFGEKGFRELYNKDLNIVLDKLSSAIKKIMDDFPLYCFNKNFINIAYNDFIHIVENEYVKLMQLEDGKDYWSDTPYNVLKMLVYIQRLVVLAIPYNYDNMLVIEGD